MQSNSFKNIALTGMMGCGKSSVAKELKNLLYGFEHVEMDEEIEKKEKLSIREIFEQRSEQYFREVESALVRELSDRNNLIISMGGGAFLKEENRKIFLKNAFCVYLKTSSNLIFERVKNDNTRPLLNVSNLKEKIGELNLNREKFYKFAHIEIITDNKTTKEIAEEILEKYKEYGY